MTATVTEQRVHALEIVKDVDIAAPIGIVFESVLEQLGPGNEAEAGQSIPMVLEAWPGGRWYRDLGDGAGHFWGTVQAIKRPTLLEICGPLFMSYPAMSNVQIRLSETEHGTHLRFVHRAMGSIAHDPAIARGWEMIDGGWTNLLTRIHSAAERSH